MSDPDDDFLDGCDLDFTIDADDDETASLRPLFPNGVADEAKAAAWRELAGGSDA
jgi:hypothetical protein